MAGDTFVVRSIGVGIVPVVVESFHVEVGEERGRQRDETALEAL
ncbi:hypothetical protein [Streptomyces canus]